MTGPRYDQAAHDRQMLDGIMGLGAARYPIRQRSLRGEPKPTTSIERTCRGCGASFVGSAPGKTGERGIWRNWRWYCSSECDPTTAL